MCISVSCSLLRYVSLSVVIFPLICSPPSPLCVTESIFRLLFRMDYAARKDVLLTRVKVTYGSFLQKIGSEVRQHRN